MKEILKRATHKGKLIVDTIRGHFKQHPVAYFIHIIMIINSGITGLSSVIKVLIYALQVTVFCSELLIQLLQWCLKFLSSVTSLFYCALTNGEKHELFKVSLLQNSI